MKRMICSLTAAVMLLCLASCGSSSSDKVFYVGIINNCAGDVSGFYYEYYLSSKPIGTGTVSYNDSGTITRGDTMYTSFIPDDFADAAKLSSFRIQFWVVNAAGEHVPAGEIWDVDAAYGNTYTFIISGSSDSGYSAKYAGVSDPVQ